jgi:ATP diphosphatase
MNELKLPPPSGAPVNIESLAESIAIMARLRAPDGCPWDREQTFDTIKRHTLEETYEVFDAIDRRAWPELKDELGDLLLQVLFYSQMAQEAGYFSIEDVAANLNAKLIRRHPHIFGDVVAETVSDVSRNWEAIKKTEKTDRGVEPPRYMDDVPRHMPALLEAAKLGSRAAKVGFDWPDVKSLFEKIKEESDELLAEVERPTRDANAVADELGDLLFTTVNLARHLQVEPEFALRAANAKFRRRFTAMEDAEGGIESLRAADSAELEKMWKRAKTSERAGV